MYVNTINSDTNFCVQCTEAKIEARMQVMWCMAFIFINKYFQDACEIQMV